MLNYLLNLLPKNSRQYREETSQRIAWGHWFMLFNIVLALIISSRYAFNADWPNTLFGKIYFFISLFGHFSFVVFACYLLLLFPLSFLVKNNRTFRGISVIFATICLTFLSIDTEVFKRFYLHLSPLVWDLLINPDEQELTRQWQLFFVPMPLILLVEMLYSRWCWQKLRSFNRQHWGKFVALFFVSCFSATHLLYAWADVSLYRPITSQKANYPLSYPMTARSFLEKHHLIDRHSYEQKIEEQGRADTFYLDYPKAPLISHSPKNKINLLVINLSGLQNNQIESQVMPNLTQISQQSRYFTQHYSGGEDKSSGIASLFYGLSGKYLDAILNEKTPSPLITILKNAKYNFGLFSHNNFKEPIYRRSLFSQFNLAKSNNNEQAIQQWQKWLNKQNSEQSFFSYLELGVNGKKQTVNIQQLDNHIGQIWQQLQQKDLLNRTLVIITADIADETAFKNNFAQQKIQVPMLIYWQGEKGYYNQLSSHLDIMPTLLRQFFGVINPTKDFSQGVDLTISTPRKWVLASNYRWNVAIMPNSEQYHIDSKGNFIEYDSNNIKQKSERPPLALFLQLMQISNQFMDK